MQNNNKNNSLLTPKTRDAIRELIISPKLNEEMERLTDLLDFLVEKCQIYEMNGLIGDAIKRGYLDANSGAQLSYPSYIHYFKGTRKRPSLAERKWGIGFENPKDFFHNVTALTALNYTQTVVLKLPNFEPSKDLKGERIENIPLDFFTKFYGLPLLVPTDQEDIIGVMLDTTLQPIYEISRTGQLTASKKAGSKTVGYLGFAVHLTLLRKDPDKISGIWYRLPEEYDIYDMEGLDLSQITFPLKLIRDAFLKELKNEPGSKLSFDVFMEALYLYLNPPYANWFRDKKIISLEINPESGEIEAQLPRHLNVTVLTTEGCFDFSNPNADIETSDETNITFQ